MTRLDENRAAAQLAAKANRQVSEVSNVTIWGNHSATQYPDYYNAKIGGVSAPEVISDDTWAHVDFIPPFNNAERQSFRHVVHPQPHLQPMRRSIR